jgi:hypothetical protein
MSRQGKSGNMMKIVNKNNMKKKQIKKEKKTQVKEEIPFGSIDLNGSFVFSPKGIKIEKMNISNGIFYRSSAKSSLGFKRFGLWLVKLGVYILKSKHDAKPYDLKPKKGYRLSSVGEVLYFDTKLLK